MHINYFLIHIYICKNVVQPRPEDCIYEDEPLTCVIKSATIERKNLSVFIHFSVLPAPGKVFFVEFLLINRILSAKSNESLQIFCMSSFLVLSHFSYKQAIINHCVI